MTITILLVPANLKVRKEALNSFIERHAMLSEFVPLEVILEIRWSKPIPIDHGSSYRAVMFSRIRCRPNVANEPRAVAIQRRVGSIRVLCRVSVLRQGIKAVKGLQASRFVPQP